MECTPHYCRYGGWGVRVCLPVRCLGVIAIAWTQLVSGDWLITPPFTLCNTPPPPPRPRACRCLKPNENKAAHQFDKKRMMHQIRYLGLLENIRVRRAGFCYRDVYQRFLERFYLISPRTAYAGDYIWRGSDVDGARCVLEDSGVRRDEWQLGQTKVRPRFSFFFLAWQLGSLGGFFLPGGRLAFDRSSVVIPPLIDHHPASDR